MENTILYYSEVDNLTRYAINHVASIKINLYRLKVKHNNFRRFRIICIILHCYQKHGTNKVVSLILYVYSHFTIVAYHTHVL